MNQSWQIAAEMYHEIDPFIEYRIAELQIRLSTAQAKILGMQETIDFQVEVIRQMAEQGRTVSIEELHRRGF